jgi:hypothetical protein
MDKTKTSSRALRRAALFSLVRGAAWAAGSALTALIITWAQQR